MKSKSIFCGLLNIIIIISLFTSIFTFEKRYSEDPEHTNKRLKYLQSKTLEMSNGLIDFVYTPEKGIYCKFTRDNQEHDYIFKIPSRYIFSYCK